MSFLSRTHVTAVLAVVLLAASSQASQVVFGNLGSDGSGELGTINDVITAGNIVAQGFSTGVASTLLYVDQVTLGLGVADDGSLSTTISLWEDVAGEPGSLVATSASETVSGLASAKYSFSFGGVALSAGSSYWVVLQQAGLDWYFVPVLAGTPSEKNSSGYSGLGQVASADGGTNWLNAGNSRYSFSLTASSTGPAPVPEPGTWAAAALLIGAAAYVRWRRRPQSA